MSRRKRVSGEGPDILPLMNGEDMEHVYIHKDAYTGKAHKVDSRHRADSLKSSRSLGALSVFDPNTTGTLPRDTEVSLDIYNVVSSDGTPYHRKSVTDSVYSTDAGSSIRQSLGAGPGELTVTRAYIVGDAGGGPGKVVTRVNHNAEDTQVAAHRTSSTYGAGVNSGAAGPGWVSESQSSAEGAHATVQSSGGDTARPGGTEVTGGMASGPGLEKANSFQRNSAYSKLVSASPYGSPQGSQTKLNLIGGPSSPSWRHSGDSGTFAITSAVVTRADSSAGSSTRATNVGASASANVVDSSASSSLTKLPGTEVTASGGASAHRDSSASRRSSGASRPGSRASTQSVTKSYMAQSSGRASAPRRESSSRSSDGRRLSSTDRVDKGHRDSQLADSQVSITSKGSSRKESNARRPSSLSPDGRGGSRQSVDTQLVDSQQAVGTHKESTSRGKRLSRAGVTLPTTSYDAPPPPVSLVSKTRVTEHDSLERKQSSGDQTISHSDSSLTKKFTSRSTGLYSIQSASTMDDEGAGKFKRMPSNPNLANMELSVAEVELSGMKSPVHDDQIKAQLSKLFGGSESTGHTKITKSITRSEKRSEITRDETQHASGDVHSISSSTSESESDLEGAGAGKEKRSSLSPGAYLAPKFTPFNYGGNTSKNEVKGLVNEGSVQKIATSLKDLPLTGRAFDRTPPPTAKTLSTPATPTSGKFKFAVEGIDVPAPPDGFKDEEYSSSAPNLHSAAATALFDSETGECSADSLQRRQKQGFTYLLDKAVSKEIIKKAEDVTARKPHETVEVKVQTRSKVDDNPVEEIQSLRDARAKLQRQSKAAAESNRNSASVDLFEITTTGTAMSDLGMNSNSQSSIDKHASNYSSIRVEETLSASAGSEKRIHGHQMSPDSAYGSSPVSPAGAKNTETISVPPPQTVGVSVQQVAASDEKTNAMSTNSGNYDLSQNVSHTSTNTEKTFYSGGKLNEAVVSREPVEVTVQQTLVSNEKSSTKALSDKHEHSANISRHSASGDHNVSLRTNDKSYGIPVPSVSNEVTVQQVAVTNIKRGYDISSKDEVTPSGSFNLSHVPHNPTGSVASSLGNISVHSYSKEHDSGVKSETESLTKYDSYSKEHGSGVKSGIESQTKYDSYSKEHGSGVKSEIESQTKYDSYSKEHGSGVKSGIESQTKYDSYSKEHGSGVKSGIESQTKYDSYSKEYGSGVKSGIESQTKYDSYSKEHGSGVKSETESQTKYGYSQSNSQYYSAKGSNVEPREEGYTATKTVSSEETTTPEVYTKTTVVEHSHTISDRDNTFKDAPTTSKSRLVEHEHRNLKTTATSAKNDANIIGRGGNEGSITNKTSSSERDTSAHREGATVEASVALSAKRAAGHTHSEAPRHNTGAGQASSAVTVTTTTTSHRTAAQDRPAAVTANSSAPGGRKASAYGAGFHPLYNQNRTLHFDHFERRPTGDASLQRDIDKLKLDKLTVTNSIQEKTTHDRHTVDEDLRVKDTRRNDIRDSGISHVPISTYVVKEEHKLSKVLSESGHINYEPREYERSDFDRSYSSSSYSDSDSESDILPEEEETRMYQQGRQAARKRSGLLVTTVSRGEAPHRQATLPEETGFGPSTNRLGRITVTDGNVQVDLNQSQEFSPYDDNTLPPNFDFSNYPTNTFKSTKSYDAGENVFALRESHLSSTTASSLSPQSSFGPASPLDERPQRIIKLRPIAVDISGMPVSPPGGRPGPGLLSPNVRHMQTTMEMSAMTGATHNYNPGSARVVSRGPTSPRLRRHERVRSDGVYTSSYPQGEVPINHVTDYTVERNAQLNFNVYAPNQKTLDQNHNVTSSQYHSQTRRTQNHLSRLHLDDDVFDASSVHSEPGRSIPVRTSSRRSPTSPHRQGASQQVRALDIAQPLHVTLPAPSPLQPGHSEGMLAVAPAQEVPLLSPTLQQVGEDKRGNYHVSIKLNQLGSVAPLHGETNTLNRSMQETTNTLNRSTYEQATISRTQQEQTTMGRTMQSQHTVHLSPPAGPGPHRSVVKLRDEAPTRPVHVGTAGGGHVTSTTQQHHTTEHHISSHQADRTGHSTSTIHHADPVGAKMAMAVNQTLTMDYSPTKHANNTNTVSETNRTFISQQHTNRESSSHRRDHGDNETDGLPQVVRGSILIKNTLDTGGATKVIDLVETGDHGEDLLVDDNTNLFHGKYYQARENPMYSSDEDLRQAGVRKPHFTEIFEQTTRSERRDDVIDGGETFMEIPVEYRNGHHHDSAKKARRQDQRDGGFSETYRQTTTHSSSAAAGGGSSGAGGSSYGGGGSSSRAGASSSRAGASSSRGGASSSSSGQVRKMEWSESDIAHLIQNAPPNSVRQRINVEREEEEVLGPLPLNHADGSNTGPDGLLNFDTVSEKVDLGVADGIAQLAVKVRCERVVPIRGVEDMFKKSSVIVTRLIDIDLDVTPERRHLLENILRGSQQLALDDGGHSSSRYGRNEARLSTKDTFKLYKTFMGMAEMDDQQTHEETIVEKRLEDERMHPTQSDQLHENGFASSSRGGMSMGSSGSRSAGSKSYSTNLSAGGGGGGGASSSYSSKGAYSSSSSKAAGKSRSSKGHSSHRMASQNGFGGNFSLQNSTNQASSSGMYMTNHADDTEDAFGDEIQVEYDTDELDRRLESDGPSDSHSIILQEVTAGRSRLRVPEADTISFQSAASEHAGGILF